MRRMLSFGLLMALLIGTASAALFESGTKDAQPTVLYGKYNNTIVPVKVAADGSVIGTPLEIYRQTDTSPTENIFTIYNAAGTEVLFQIDSTGMPTYQPSATSPAVVAGTGAGTGPILTIVGSDTGGIITLTTGTSCATSATVLTATFETLSLSFAPGVILYPMDTDASALTGAAQVYTNSTTTTFTIKVGSTALADSTEYVWAYKLAAY